MRHGQRWGKLEKDVVKKLDNPPVNGTIKSAVYDSTSNLDCIRIF